MAKYALIFLPPWSTFYPYSSLALLKGHLQFKGHEVSVFDFNVTFFAELLSKQTWRDLYDRLRQKEREFQVKGSFDLHLETLKCLKLAETIEENLPLCWKTFKNRTLFFNPFRLHNAVNTYEWVFKALNLVLHPNQLLFSAMQFGYADILISASTQGLVQIRDFFDSYLESWSATVLSSGCDAVGFSIINEGQFSLSTRLAHQLRQNGFTGSIGFGGPFVDDHHHQLCQDRFLMDLVQIRNHGSAERAEMLSEFRIDPSVFLSESYLAPEPVIGLPASFGCNWNRCAFCSYSRGQTDYIEADPERVAEAVSELRENHGFRYYHFDESSITPSFLKSFAKSLILRGVDIKWRAMIRVESEIGEDDIRLLSESGCRWLSFGMESLSPRVLDKMNKGVDADRFHPFLLWCNRYHICTDAFFMKNFPGESPSEQQTTLDFLNQHNDLFTIFSFTDFFLTRGSAIDRRPESFGFWVDRNTDLQTPYSAIFAPYLAAADRNLSSQDLSQKAADFQEFADAFDLHGDYMAFDANTFMKGLGISINYLFRVLYAFEGIDEPRLPAKLAVNPEIRAFQVESGANRAPLSVHFPRGTCNTLEGEDELMQLLERLRKPLPLREAFALFQSLYTRGESLVNIKRLYLNGFLHGH